MGMYTYLSITINFKSKHASRLGEVVRVVDGDAEVVCFRRGFVGPDVGC